jgi:hypothetical protein
VIVIVVVILAIGGYWYVRRDEKEELPELRPLTPFGLISTKPMFIADVDAYQSLFCKSL